MPVKRSQFEKGLGNVEYAVLEFLYKNKDEAFTLDEIAKRLQLDSNKESLEVWFYLLLAGLENRGYIKRVELDRKSHYAISADVLRTLEAIISER